MASSACVVDTSVFVAFYREADIFHADALRIVRELSERSLIVHPYVIQETATVLAYGAGLPLAKQFLVDVATAANVIIPAIDVHADMRAFMRANKKMSFTDIALIELASEIGARILTFDRQMRAASHS